MVIVIVFAVAMLALLSAICIYGALASLVNCIFSQRVLPMGPSLIKVTNQETFCLPLGLSYSIIYPQMSLTQEEAKEESAAELPCPVHYSRLTSGLLKIAGILEAGGVCGIPTDTVYALAASCKNPQAIEKIYNIKVRGT